MIIMKQYRKFGGDAGVSADEIGTESRAVQFSIGTFYTDTY